MAPISNADFFFCKNFELESCRAVHCTDSTGETSWEWFNLILTKVVMMLLVIGRFLLLVILRFLVIVRFWFLGDFEDDSDKEKRLEMLIEQELSASGGCLGISNALHEI